MPGPTNGGGGGAYARSGVNIDTAARALKNAGEDIRSTYSERVLGRSGGFGGLFDASFPEIRHPVLVSSVDSVGTKVKVAAMAGRYETVGQDLVNHCVNDIAVMGARPLYFLDYLGTGKLEEWIFRQLIQGLAKACRENNCALIGGETAEMPGIYHGDDFDLAGAITGLVEKDAIIDGQDIVPGDLIYAWKSNGLHTNGFTLVRRVLFEEREMRLDDLIPYAKRTVEEELLRVHPSYLAEIQELGRENTKGLAHITGGGLIDNLPRILPENCGAVIDATAWRPEPIFTVLQEWGEVGAKEAFRTFNMGIGMAVVVSPAHGERAAAAGAFPIGEVVEGDGQVSFSGLDMSSD